MAERLGGRARITAQQAAWWIVLDDDPVIWHGQDSLGTGPIATFAREIIDIIRGSLRKCDTGTPATPAIQATCAPSDAR